MEGSSQDSVVNAPFFFSWDSRRDSGDVSLIPESKREREIRLQDHDFASVMLYEIARPFDHVLCENVQFRMMMIDDDDDAAAKLTM